VIHAVNSKFLSVNVDNEEQALYLVEKIETVLKEDSFIYRWDYEINE
jgi:hypothetical protein